MDDFEEYGFTCELGGFYEAQEIPEESDVTDLDEGRRTVQVFKTMGTAKKMKLLSEASLDAALPWHPEQGECWHCISFGDVDSLTYLRHMVRQSPLDYCLISTWCMAMEDAREVADWVERGFVKRIDFYVGEIFKDGYRGVRAELERIAGSCGGRVARFRNHSKVMVGLGGGGFVIESSANVNTNPRCENTVLTMDTGLAEFYKGFYDGIRGFDGDPEGWEPWEQG